MGEFSKGIGTNLKLLRKVRNLTQEQLCELIGIHPRQLSKIENGAHMPSERTLINICHVLQIQPYELCHFELSAEAVRTGTDNHFIVLKRGNLITLKHIEEKTVKTINESELDFEKIAKKLNCPISVQVVENNKTVKLSEVQPDGHEKIYLDYTDEELFEDTKSVINDCIKLLKEKKYTDFIKTAIAAPSDTEALEKLNNLIQGMRMVLKK